MPTSYDPPKKKKKLSDGDTWASYNKAVKAMDDLETVTDGTGPESVPARKAARAKVKQADKEHAKFARDYTIEGMQTDSAQAVNRLRDERKRQKNKNYRPGIEGGYPGGKD